MSNPNLPLDVRIDKFADDLVDLLKIASDAYYNSTPIMTDEEFDGMVEQLRVISPEHPFLKAVGAPVIGAWPKKKHQYMMGSQEKVKTEEDFMKWAEGKGDLVITDKMDGSTIAITYEDGKLVSGVTRGDGTEGEDITPNVLKMQNVAKTIHGFTGVLRGEMVVYLDDFKNFLAPQGYKNPRNAANGIARDKSGDLMKHIKVIYFDVLGADLKTEMDKMRFVTDNGLTYVRINLANAAETWQLFKGIEAYRAKTNWEMDGAVVKMNDLAAQSALGDLNGRPRGQIAIKFVSQSKETKIAQIEWQVGRNGRITPVATLEPCEIGGVTITRCTLNNRNYVAALGASVGATVVLTRANDVIPAITGVSKPGTGVTNEPTKCPSCQGILEIDGAYIFCPMIDCQGKTVGGLAKWLVSTKVRGVGPNILAELVNLGITDPAKLYAADQSVFNKAAGSDKNGEKIYHQVQESRNIDLATFLYGLNIDHLGEINARRFEKHFKTLDALMGAEINDLSKVQGVKTTADDIFHALAAKASLIRELAPHVKFKTLEAKGPLAGKSFCITGELSEDRDTVHEWIRSRGGETKTGVSKNLDYLVTNDTSSGSSKNVKAAALGVKVISEDDLRKMGA